MWPYALACLRTSGQAARIELDHFIPPPQPAAHVPAATPSAEGRVARRLAVHSGSFRLDNAEIYSFAISNCPCAGLLRRFDTRIAWFGRCHGVVLFLPELHLPVDQKP